MFTEGAPHNSINFRDIELNCTGKHLLSFNATTLVLVVIVFSNLSTQSPVCSIFAMSLQETAITALMATKKAFFVWLLVLVAYLHRRRYQVRI